MFYPISKHLEVGLKNLGCASSTHYWVSGYVDGMKQCVSSFLTNFDAPVEEPYVFINTLNVVNWTLPIFNCENHL